MVEAVSENGYERTSVKQVVGLAGVSRRAFYEQFANKEECFLATFDLIAARCIRRITDAYRSSEGDFEDRLRSAFLAFANELETNTKEAHLVVIDAQLVGINGMLRMRRTTSAFEHLISSSFAHTQGVTPLPRPVVRAIVGGLRRVTFLHLHDGRVGELRSLVEEMLHWTLLFQTPAVNDLETGASSSGPPQPPAQVTTNARKRRDERMRILDGVLELAISEDYQELSAPRIADEAQVSVEFFFELFADRDECFLAAFDALGDELLGVISDPRSAAPTWPGSVHGAIDVLMRHLAANPVHAETIAMSALAAGDTAIEHAAVLMRRVSTTLIAGAPASTGGHFITEGIAGAIWHTIHCHVASRQTRMLPTLSDYLTFVVLAPFVGAEEAAHTVTGTPA
ncbi:MAG TPA: TetR/AcrR family transcriptional regulator [Solirubrobacteraceae bacterium]|nr:TetR/AcrR family transcriptional regulator [Solirubrobacteraceae bacterium]